VKGVPSRKIALGIEPYIDSFARANDAESWKQFAAGDPLAWQAHFMEVMNDPNGEVLFNLQGVDVWAGATRAATGRGGATDWELTLLTDGLKKAGRALDRESFVSAMKQVALATPGEAVPISFGPGRRVGIQGVCIVRLELRGHSAAAVAQTEPENRLSQQRDGEKRTAAEGRTIQHYGVRVGDHRSDGRFLEASA
jgi:hypothetical protein